jgi:putative membrane protein insertion efficiency factor
MKKTPLNFDFGEANARREHRKNVSVLNALRNALTSKLPASIKIFSFFIKLYQTVISPYIGPRCRYLPTCSDYALEALQVHGITRGLYYTMHRLLRCNPWGGSGYDPIPLRKTKEK